MSERRAIRPGNLSARLPHRRDRRLTMNHSPDFSDRYPKPPSGPIEAHEWGEWSIDRGHTSSAILVKRTARVWQTQYLNAAGQIRNRPSHFRTREAAQAAIDKFNKAAEAAKQEKP